MNTNTGKQETMNEYWKRVCERDAAWDLFCAFPSRQTWLLFDIAKEAERIAEQAISNE